MFGLFKKEKSEENKPKAPEIMGLRLGGSFKLDALLFRLIESDLIIEDAHETHIIQAAGIADLDGDKVLRFYTDDDAFLQVIVSGALSEENVVDVKLFYFYDTLDVGSQSEWDALLNTKIGQGSYELEGHQFHRVWTSTSDYHNPVAMTEKTYDSELSVSETDQFVMLFERDIGNGRAESLFLSAEEQLVNTTLERCFVLSTGITLSPEDLTIIG